MQNNNEKFKIKKIIQSILNFELLFCVLRFAFCARFRAKRESGFTLLEAIVAIFILLVGTTGAVTLVSRSATNLGVSSDRLVATNIAQEGIEIIHNVRDNNWLNSDNLPTPPAWNDWDGPADGSGAGKVCDPCVGYVWWSSIDLSMGPEPGVLRWNPGTRHYAYDGTVGDSFSRIITIQDDPSGEGVPTVRGQAVVGWGEAGNCTLGGVNTNRRYCVALEERLYDWR